MTTQEKAKELHDKFAKLELPDLQRLTSNGVFGHVSKQCAVIFATEMQEEYIKMLQAFDGLSQLVGGFKTDQDFDENMKHIKEDQIKPYIIGKILFWELVTKEILKL